MGCSGVCNVHTPFLLYIGLLYCIVMRSFFSIEELVASETADRMNLDNTPDSVTYEHLFELIDFLNMLRGWYGKPMIVSSGYRCPELNRAVGGVRTSAHQIGYAADLVPKRYCDFQEMVSSVIDFLERTKIPFDECIIEGAHGKRWLHVALKSIDGQQRRKLMVIKKD